MTALRGNSFCAVVACSATLRQFLVQAQMGFAVLFFLCDFLLICGLVSPKKTPIALDANAQPKCSKYIYFHLLIRAQMQVHKPPLALFAEKY